MSNAEAESAQGPDVGALRQALGCFVTGVTVVTTRDAAGVPHGFTANSFTSVSLDPPLVLVCVGHEVEGLEAFRECAGFAVNILSESQRAISRTFASDCSDRFADARCRAGSYGSPILDGCVASLECETWQRSEAGDHMILIGRVLAFEHTTGRPLAFWRGSYLSLPPARAGVAHGDGRDDPPVC